MDSTREKTRVEMTMIGITFMIFPVCPSTASSGAKAATVVRTAKTTGTATSEAPSTAARSPSLPPSKWV